MTVNAVIVDVVEQLLALIDPLRIALESPGRFKALLARFGWPPPVGYDLAPLISLFAAIGDLSGIAELAAKLEDDGISADPATVESLVAKIKGLIDGVRGLVQTPPTSLLAPFDKTSSFWTTFPGELFEDLLIQRLKVTHSTLSALLQFTGILKESTIPAVGNRATYVSHRIVWNNIPRLLNEPTTLLSETYSWDDPANPFDHSAALRNLANLVHTLNPSPEVADPDPRFASMYYSPKNPAYSTIQELRGPVFEGYTSPTGQYALGFYVLPIPSANDTNGAPVGLVLGTTFEGQVSGVQLPVGPFTISFEGGMDVAVGPRIEFRPAGVTLVLQGAPPTINVAAAVKYGRPQPQVLFGVPGSVGIQLESVTAGIRIRGAVDAPEFVFELSVKNLEVVLQFGTSDGFLQHIFGSDQQSAKMSMAIHWSSKSGLSFDGGAAAALTLPLHLKMGIVKIDTITIEISAQSGQPVRISGGLTGTVALGPVAVTADRVGVLATLRRVADGESSGSLGPVDLKFGFKPPNGLGFSIDAAAVAGGGYILFDQDKGEYAGFLDISIAEIIQVKFIAILDTKLPDGSKGYSLLFIIFMELPPIQLSFGFTLNGVGGVAGVNRTMSTDGLQVGLHNHTMDYVINPPRSIADAPKVISAVSSFFPAATGRYLFGPILELGWETFVILTVGVLLEVPDPIKLAILGIIDIFLPTIEEPDLALVKIHIDVLGLIDFGTKKISIDGSMYDSRVLEYTLAGDFAFRTSYGPNPNTLLSIGGFNPHFNTTGLDVPQLQRVMISISAGDNPVISASAYLALTSNTIQFGANVEAHASAGSFAVHGYLGFDLLVIIQRPTVSFEFDFAASFDVSYKGHGLAGINVTGQLTGTTPWHLHGDASLHILFFSVSKSVDFTWGDTLTPAPPPEAVLPDLIPALQDPQNWSATLPDGTTQCATLSVPKANQATILVHPMGMLSVREKVVPLDFSITRYKGGTPSDGSYFAIGDVHINNAPVSKETFPDFFATGQFMDLSDADKLSRSSFDPYDAGAKIASSNICSGADSARAVTYDEYYIDDPVSPMRSSPEYVMPSDVYDGLSHQSAGFYSALKNTGFNKYRVGPSTPAATIKDPSYVVASVDDLSVRSDIVARAGVTYYQARAVLKAHVAKNPQDASNLQIVPVHELTP